MKRQCRNEVEQLHQFFTDWFTGAAEDNDANFERVAAVLAAEFRLISPRGVLDDRASILRSIRAGHGKRADDFRIWIERCEARFEDGALCLLSYQEWQALPEGKTARWATALFRANPAAPNRVEWVHLQETWLPDKIPALL